MSQELKAYIEQSFQKGRNKNEIKQTLIDSGWSGKIISQLLSEYVGVDGDNLPIPAPRMKARHLSQDLFLYLLSLITLVLSTWAIGNILFVLINHWIPDVSQASDYYVSVGVSSINWGIAQFVIAFPVFTWVTYLIGKDLGQNSEKRDSFTRKLMIYLTLALSAIVTIIDLIWTLTEFLNGSVTAQFFAKALVVLSLSTLVFVYYLYEIRRDDKLIKEEN